MHAFVKMHAVLWLPVCCLCGCIICIAAISSSISVSPEEAPVDAEEAPSRGWRGSVWCVVCFCCGGVVENSDPRSTLCLRNTVTVLLSELVWLVQELLVLVLLRMGFLF